MMTTWTTDLGEFPIPDHLKYTLFTKEGLPDKRCKQYAEFMKWVDILKETTLSGWIPASTPPVHEGVYQTKEVIEQCGVSTGFQRYKDGIWGSWAPTLIGHIHSYPACLMHVETSYPPTHWRGVIECQ